MDKLKITLTNGEETELLVDAGTSIFELCQLQKSRKYPVLAARVNNKLVDVSFKLEKDSQVTLYDISSEIGHRVYVQSLIFIFIKAVSDVLPGSKVMVEHSLSKGIYCEIKGTPLTLSKVKAIEAKMKAMVEADLPFEKVRVTREEAIDIFKQKGMEDKVRMLHYLSNPKGHINQLDQMQGFFYSHLAPSTGYISLFQLQFHLPGVVIQFPLSSRPYEIPEYLPQPKLAKIFYEAERWADILEVDIVASLNDAIVNGGISQLIKVAEALHEKKVANIADEIYAHKDRGNVILIAGPSSSGKTTFAQRLMIQLMVNGLKPVSISVDDYFVNRDQTPLDEFGQYDFESLDALDVELFNDHLSRIIQGEEVELPSFNFKTGQREYKGHKVKIKADQPIIIEGIHGLNEKLTYSIPKDHKFKIYISALTQLNIDNHNRIPTTDVRKLRRLVRDNQYRGTSAINTLRIWPSVRRGEERNIFPFQEEADIMFNSALIYELAVLKPFAEKLLCEIGEEHVEFMEAQRLLKFLSYFLTVPADQVPTNSILREFVG